MSTPTSESKVLRIGVIQGGKVIEERLVRKRGTVTFGKDDNCTFVFAEADMPRSWPLFELKGDKFFLVFTDAMDGRVSVDSSNIDFAGLKAQNLAEKQGDRYRFALSEASRGRVQIAPDVTILFHFVAAPPIAPKPELPMSVKGGLVKSIEPFFTGTLAASFLLHAIIALLISTVEAPPPPSAEDVRRLIERITPPKVPAQAVNVPTPDGPKQDDGAGKKEEKKEEEPKPSGEDEGAKSAKKGKQGDPGAEAARREAVRQAVSGKGLLAMIGASGEGSGSVANVFGSGSVIGGDLQKGLEGTAGVGVAGAGEVTRRGEGGGGGDAASLDGLATSGGGTVGTGQKAAAKVTGRVKADDVEALDGKIDKKSVAAAIRRRADAFQACYESALKSNSKLGGKLVIEFTISEQGKVTDADVVKDGLGSSEVSRCVIDTLKRIRFPAPSDGEVTIANTFVFQPGGG